MSYTSRICIPCVRSSTQHAMGIWLKMKVIIEVWEFTDSHFTSGYSIRFDHKNQLKISVKWTASYDYYKSAEGWVEDQWTHLVFTWAAGKRIRAYLNGCDMDADDSRDYAYVETRNEPISASYSFRLGNADAGRRPAVGVTMDELCIWDEQLNPQQIWQFYVRGGTMRSGWFYIDLDYDNTSALN